MNFNEKLIMLRKNKNLSQEQLGNELNVARQTVSKWELGETTPEMDKLIKMSEIFEISLDELVKDNDIEITSNDINNTNTQKLAGMVINILKGIGKFLIVTGIVCLIIIIFTFIAYNLFKGDYLEMREEIGPVEDFVIEEDVLTEDDG